ncbi:hypothetical protein K7X08_003599 [Anisodus acutangulus]|uniref:Integral membrane bound transporter domain-containing protein n=1 Tax=Anisodus acutangulus TaxID=402998 RepID=A0A9Q1MFY0_9SOLA|nr:hypothetical protein K7X08_003599 [Anisodus acutangulus]
MATPTFESSRARAMWQTCLASALRTALACTIVGLSTLFGPQYVKKQVTYPAFSYVTVILVVTDATLGDTFRGCWLALYATIQGVCPTILSLWLIGPARLMASTTAIAVALSAFVVVLPENTHLIAKRIALGQIVLVYVIAYINGGLTETIMHPVHVAASTGLGVVACVLALIFPYPCLACCEVKQNCKLFAENASERFNLFVKAFSAEDNTCALAFISQAKSLVKTGAKLLQGIKAKQESMKWERFPFKFLRPYGENPGSRFQDLQTPLRWMEIALDNSPPFPVGILNSELKSCLYVLGEHISEKVNSMSLESSATVPESNPENTQKFFQTLDTIQPTKKDLPSLFFLFCLSLFINKPIALSPPKEGSTKQENQEGFLKQTWTNYLSVTKNNKRFMAAFKCSLSLGLAIFFGLTYSKENGFWAGLPVAISLAGSREATFKIANVKAQGTVLGTIYGILGCFVFEKYVQIRFLSLLPWFIVSSFLRQSQMYGQAGGLSAIIGAVLILGRKGFGPPSEFAIARITETFIGLSCSIMVEILLQPTRASTLAKFQLSKNFEILHECIGSICFGSLGNLVESQNKLKVHINEMGKFIGEAEAEPNFWFVPFHGTCYRKLMGSLSKMLEYLHFGLQALLVLEKECGGIDNFVNKLDGDFKLFKDFVGSSMKCFEEVSLVKSLAILDKEFEKKLSVDVELGTSQSSCYNIIRSASEEEIDENFRSYFEHSKELVDQIVNGEECKGQVVLSLSALAFCMDRLVKETKEIEKAVKELVQWDNPSSHVNLHDISFKVRAFANSEAN